MKKLFNLFAVFSLSAITATTTSSVISCYEKALPPGDPLSEQIKITDLGDFSGEESLPTKKELVDRMNEVNFDDAHAHLRFRDDQLEIVGQVTTTSATIKARDDMADWNPGTVTLTYIYSQKEIPEISTFGAGSSASDIIDHYGTLEEISKFSNKVSNYDFFTRISSKESLGYTTGEKGEGLCEYISLTTLINYFQLYRKNNYYESGLIDKYYYNFNKNLIKHKNYGDRNPYALPYIMWNKNGRNKDFWFGSEMRSALKSWIGKSKFSNLKDDYSTSTMHSSSPEKWLLKYDVPVLLSFTKYGGHNVLIYAYDKKTNSYAVNFGWPGTKYSVAIIKKTDIWSYFSAGFWYAFREK